MTDTIVDYDQRRQALAPDHSFIVQAPAGSGKTELLIRRYLSLLARVDYPEEIVAVTFTRKAAAEMRGRIISSLEQARDTQQAVEQQVPGTLDLARAVLARDRQLNWQLESSPGRLRIQTIDSLCAWLTRQMPIMARFGAQPETLEDASELYQEAANAVLTELENGAGGAGCAVLLTHLDNNLPRLRDLLAGILAKREHWLRHLGGGVDRAALEAALQHSVTAALERTRNAFPEQYRDEFLACLRYAAEHLQGEEQHTSLPDFREQYQLPAASVGGLPLWKTIADICLTRSNSWRKRIDKQLFPSTKEGKQWKERLQVLLGCMSGEDLQQQLIETRNLPVPAYTDREWQVIDALCRLLIRADAGLRVIFAARNRIDFSGIALAAIAALGEEDDPTDLALHLDYRIRHLLVDEYQDVSINQYRLLEHLTAGWSSQDGHTLFLVGDPMQSIYRFREAEVGMYMVTWEQQRLGQVSLTALRLSVNFRSQAGIVDWINAAFSRILPGRSDSRYGGVAYAGAQAIHPRAPGNAVEIHPFLGPGTEQEAALIADLAAASRGGSTAILVRSRAHLGDIVLCLKARGMRFRAVEIEALGTRPAIRDLLALTEALHHSADRIAWLAILRAPWCGMTLADLHALVTGSPEQTVWECMQDETRLRQLSPEGLRGLLKVREVMQLHFAEQHRRSLRRAVESVWMSLGGPATLEDESDLENTRTYLELLEQFDEGGDLGNKERFIERVASLFAAADVHADDSLQVMTIHKAKGLEFDTVILPGLGRGTRSDDPQLLLWTEVPHGLYQELLLAPIKESGSDASPIYAYLQGLERHKQYYEAGRLLYVAATRARHQLHLLGNLNVKDSGGEAQLAQPRNGSLLAQLWPVVQKHYARALEHYRAEVSAAGGDQQPELALRRLHPDWEMPDTPPPVAWRGHEGMAAEQLPAIEYEWAGLTIRHIGTLVHRCIRSIADLGMDQWGADRIRACSNRFRQSLRELGVPEHELDGACQRVAAALLNFIKDERGQWLLAHHEQQKNEFAVSGVLGGRVVNIIVDRTFVDQDGVRWIVDYKTSSHEGTDIVGFLDLQQERYRQQLEKYGALFSRLEERPIRLGLYFPLLGGWREWEYK